MVVEESNERGCSHQAGASFSEPHMRALLSEHRQGLFDRAAMLFRSLDAAAMPTASVAEGRAEEEGEEIDEEAVEVSEDTGPLNIEEGKSDEDTSRANDNDDKDKK